MKPLKKEPEVSQESKEILDGLIKIGECSLVEFQSKFELSNKKWDKVLKELRGKELIKIYKAEDDKLLIKPL